MKKLVSFFEIPAVDFNRAVMFYENLFGVGLEMFECSEEKMAFFPKEDGLCPGAISWSRDHELKPSAQGMLLSFNCDDMEAFVKRAAASGGKVVIPKTKIEAEGRGYFCVLTDSEGNRFGLNSDN